jgi:glucosyl-dolichyl phosphate glucuronosyltransferase
MINNIQISVIICTYNRANYILLALESLIKQTLSKNQFEVFVVDNNSMDNTEEVCNKFVTHNNNLNIQYLQEKQQGSSFARNKGAKLANGEWLCFMDDDAIAEEQYLENILSFFGKNSQANAVGGRIIPRYIPEKPAWMSYHVSSLIGNFDYAKEVVEFSAEKYPLESNMVVGKKDFKNIGGFSENIPGVKGTLRIGGEGKDLFFRLKARGVRVYYDPNIIVEHITEIEKLTPEYMYRVASGIGRGERVRTLAINKWAFTKKIVEYIYKLLGSIILGIMYTIKGNSSQFMPVVKYRIDALKGLLGN